MQKKTLIIVVHHLTVGGIQKALISALNLIDYDKYDVTLYVRKNRTNLLGYINKNVNIIINNDKTRYYRKPISVLYLILIFVFSLFKNNAKCVEYESRLNEKIRQMQMIYESQHYFKNKSYDIAAAYSQGFTAEFVDKYINAKKKIAFFHSAVEEQPDLYDNISGRFDAFAVLNDLQRQSVEKWYPKSIGKTFIVSNYVDSQYVIKSSQEYTVAHIPEKTVICTCGRMSKEKGFDLACRAAAILKRNSIGFIWRFIGDGAERKNIEELINRLDIADNIELCGMLENPYPYIAACDLYVQPSYSEAYGLSIREAQLLFRPVISTKTMGGSTLIKDMYNGMLCDFSPEALAEAVTLMLTDDDLYKSICDNVKEYSADDEAKCRAQWDRLLEC